MSSVPTHGNPYGDLMVSPSLQRPGTRRWAGTSPARPGPGGQGVNTADSRVELSIHLPSLPGWPEPMLATAIERLAGRLVDGTLTVSASEHRQQIRNREAARARMASSCGRRSRRPDHAAADPAERRRPATSAGRKRHRSEIKQDVERDD